MEPSPEDRRLANLPERVEPIRAVAKYDSQNIHQILNLQEAVELLAAHLPGIRSIYLFGSRRFETGSVRSDVDLLIDGDQLPQASVVAAIARDIDSYLDVFVVRGGTAQSAINESVIAGTDLDALLNTVNAVPLWRSSEGWVSPMAPALRVLAGFHPPATIANSPGPEPLVDHADVLFVSGLSKEHHAITAQFDRILTTPPKNAASYLLGEIHTEDAVRRVAACVADRAGTIPAALTTSRGIEYFRPNSVVLVGITAGVTGRLNQGDLIVPDTIVEYEATKVGPNGEDNHGRMIPLDPGLLSGVQAWPGRHEWLREISAQKFGGGLFQLSTDSMASGNKVVASRERAALIAAGSRKIAAIEMESLGVVEACLRADPAVPMLVVKAVSDLADEAKDDSWHQFATFAAAQLAAALVRDSVI